MSKTDPYYIATSADLGNVQAPHLPEYITIAERPRVNAALILEVSPKRNLSTDPTGMIAAYDIRLEVVEGLVTVSYNVLPIIGHVLVQERGEYTRCMSLAKFNSLYQPIGDQHA